MSSGHRILSMAHGHPDHVRGGAEIAAYDLHGAYSGLEKVEAAWFLARAELGRGPRGRITTWQEDEYLWEQSLADLFMMRAQNRFEVTGYFSEFLSLTRPTLVHTHHYFQFGLEYLRAIKLVDPSIRTVLTLHEYIAICPNRGMMQSMDGDHCQSGRYLDHLNCHAEATRESLWLRKHRFERYFDFVDTFICPSEFLRDRYAEWGISTDRLHVVENGLAEVKSAPPHARGSGTSGNRFGFFGQISEHKGLDTVLEGLLSLSPEARQKIVVEVNGANLERQSRAFRERVSSLALPLIQEGVVHWRGSYNHQELGSRMASVDWVILPSVWVENSPLVIQEAHGHGRPVIASDMGAMPEKLGPAERALMVAPGDPRAWAERLVDVADRSEILREAQSTLTSPQSIEVSAKACLAIVDGLGN